MQETTEIGLSSNLVSRVWLDVTTFLTSEYVKRYEGVIGEGGKFTHSLHPSAINFMTRNALFYFCYECVA